MLTAHSGDCGSLPSRPVKQIPRTASSLSPQGRRRLSSSPAVVPRQLAPLTVAVIYKITVSEADKDTAKTAIESASTDDLKTNAIAAVAASSFAFKHLVTIDEIQPTETVALVAGATQAPTTPTPTTTVDPIWFRGQILESPVSDAPPALKAGGAMFLTAMVASFL